MNYAELIDLLNSLTQLDFDAIRSYDQAGDEIADARIRERCRQFHQEHQRHAEELSMKVDELGGLTVERSPDWKGFFLETFSAIRPLAGIEAALSALRTNEETANRMYNDALARPLPPDVRSLLEQNCQDEGRHLEYVEGVLAGREWEAAVRRR